jgi:secreted Zn-dependent insulinase-like peptidase
MRAEVEAEVRREQERLAQMVQQTRTIGTPVRRFSFGT